MSREWTTLDNDPRWDDEDYYYKVKPELDALAREWSRIHDNEEQERFIAEDHWGGDYDWEPEELEFFKTQERVHEMIEAAKMEAIENRLAELGARMMRPYEHWNEEERYMQYMEVDRFG